MLRQRIFHSRWLIFCLCGAFAFLLLPLDLIAWQQAQPPATGSLIGFIYAEDMKTPVEKAVVRLRNLNDGEEYASSPTDATGVYRLTGIKEGSYILGVSTPAGDFNFEYILMVKANEVGKLSLALKPGAASRLAQEEEKEKEKKKPFFLTPIGIAILVAGSALAIYGTYKLLEELGVISPSKR